jgi:pyridoxal phosphate-dependent aminotransferase EpsN
MLVSDDGALIERARELAERSREPSLGGGHREMGYDYRMSGLLAALGRARLGASEARVDARREIHRRYQEALGDVPGVALQPDVPWGRHSRRYSCLTVDPARAGVGRDAVRSALALRGIETRPLWTPAHLHPLYRGMEGIGGRAAERISRHGLCLPSSPAMTAAEADEVAGAITACLERGPAAAPPESP